MVHRFSTMETPIKTALKFHLSIFRVATINNNNKKTIISVDTDIKHLFQEILITVAFIDINGEAYFKNQSSITIWFSHSMSRYTPSN